MIDTPLEVADAKFSVVRALSVASLAGAFEASLSVNNRAALGNVAVVQGAGAAVQAAGVTISVVPTLDFVVLTHVVMSP